MSDYLLRILTKGGTVRALACCTTELVEEARQRHGALPLATVAMGRALTGGVLLGALLKGDQRLALKFEGNGPLQKVMVEAEPDGTVRGFVAAPEAELPLKSGKLDVAGGIGRAGFLSVSKDLGLKEPYRGLVQLYTSEIGEDLAYYLTESEQTPSAVGLGVFVDPSGSVAAAGGFLIQTVPPGDDALIEQLMGRIAELPPLSELFLLGTTPEQLLERLFADIPYTSLERRELRFRCTCTREKIERVLLSLGRAELERLLAEQHGAAVTCEFCRELYAFDAEAVATLINELTPAG
jgi:molecular chaperone Hsp33